MSEREIALPPSKVAAGLLRETTERLAREVVQSSRSAPDWNDLEWAVATAVSGMQGISALLANRLIWSGPPVWQSFLNEQREQSLLLHSKIGALLARLDEALRDAGCGAVALKGAAIRALGVHAPGERPMADVDLLVNPDDMALVETALRRVHYFHSCTIDRHAIFEPHEKSEAAHFGEHIENPLRIEVHTKVAESLPFTEVNITECLIAPGVIAGLNSYPGVAELLLHVLLHTAGSMRANAARQIQFHDIAALARRMDESGWKKLFAVSPSGERCWWMYPPLAIANRYYANTIPSEVLRDAAGMCPRALRNWAERRSLTDISWSNLRIHAFPGIYWARTPLEAARYVRGRTLPSRAVVSDFHRQFHKHARLHHTPWFRFSRGRRALRWLLSSPPRVQTMFVLESALERARNAESI